MMELTKGTYILENKIQGSIIIYNIYNSSYVKLRTNEIEENRKEIEKLLVKDGFLFNEIDAVSLPSLKSNSKNTIYFKITNNCNLSCEFCCSNSSKEKFEPFTNLNKFKKIFKWFKFQ